MIFEQAPLMLLSLYGIASLLTFSIYAVDKAAAKKGAWRIKESTLHLWSFIGGWPGALVAQKTLRHKTRKQPFRFIFWVTVVLNIGLLVILYESTSLVDSVFSFPIR